MALIDEYKQAIQDVLDGRAKPAPKPSELPWTEDKAATMWAAAAAELIAEAAIPEPGAELPDTPGTDGTYALQNTVESGEGTLSWASGGGSGGGALVVTLGDNYYPNETYAEIVAAADNGPVILKYAFNSNVTGYFPLVNSGWDGLNNCYQATFYDFVAGDRYTYMSDDGGAWTDMDTPS